MNMSDKILISVDIQEDYSNYISFDLSQYADFINSSWEEVRQMIFLYNGESLGFRKESEYKMWLYEIGIEESVIEGALFYDKGYAFFRSFMDLIGNDDDMIIILKYMIQHDISDSRDIDDEQIEELITKGISEDSAEFLQKRGDQIYIPEVFDFLEGKNNIVLCGGGRNECLKEVEILLMLRDTNYSLLNRFVY